jgi:hypothetical protein
MNNTRSEARTVPAAYITNKMEMWLWIVLEVEVVSKKSWPTCFQETLQIFSWKWWGKTQGLSVGKISKSSNIRNQYLPQSNLRDCCYNLLIRSVWGKQKLGISNHINHRPRVIRFVTQNFNSFSFKVPLFQQAFDYFLWLDVIDISQEIQEFTWKNKVSD